MSVRRLAEEAVQPDDFKFTPENDNWFEGELKKYPEGRQRSAIIPALMRAQEQEGWVTKRAIEHIADRLDMPYIRALEVATFYTQFMLAPVGTRAHLQVCGTTPCMLRGSEELFAVCKKRIGDRPLVPNAEGTLSWEEVECQGACVNAPMIMIGKDAYEDLSPERLEEIIDAFENGKGDQIKPGPQIDRHLSAPVGGRVTLLDDEAIDEAAHDKAPLDGREGTSEGAQVPPSEAARPDTHAQVTDPVYAGPKNAPDVDPAAEDAPSSDPAPGEKEVGVPKGGDGGSKPGARDGLSGTTFGNTDGPNPALDQKKAVDPREAGKGNLAVAAEQAARDPRGAAVGGTQKSTPVQSVHRDDDRMIAPSDDTSISDTTGAVPGTPTRAGTKADVDQLVEQRDARSPIGADGTAAGDGAIADPKAREGGRQGNEGVDPSDEPVKTDSVTTPGGVADAPPRGGAAAASGSSPDTDDDGPEAEPDRLSAPREGGADDLKLIWGVGPKLEAMLHEMGFFHFDQIAGWGEDELNWVDRRLTGFRGRARRDQWVEQAKRLATGWRPDEGHGENPHG